MAIVDLDFVKDWLGIEDETYDSKITSLIPLVEEDYLRLRNIPFETETVAEVKTIETTTVDEDTGEETTTTEEVETGEMIEQNSYPAGADITAAEMIGFKLQNRNNFDIDEKEKGNLSSETISTYSASYDTSSINSNNMIGLGYPIDISSQIKRFVRMA